jgi:hypothetical protein
MGVRAVWPDDREAADPDQSVELRLSIEASLMSERQALADRLPEDYAREEFELKEGPKAERIRPTD